MTTQTKRLVQLIIPSAVVLLLIIGILNAPSLLVVNTEDGATVSITKNKNDSFKTIGFGGAKKFIFGKPAAVYVSSSNDGKQTITSVQLHRFKKATVNIDLKDLSSVKKISSGALIDAIFRGNQGQGIVPGQNTLINFSTSDTNEPVNPELAGLPYVKKVIWYDFNNFVYLSDDGLGQFLNGKDLGQANVATKVSGDVNITSTNQQGSPIITDMSRSPGKPLVLLSTNNVFTASNYGSSLQAIYSFTGRGDTTIYTSANSIFKATSFVGDDEQQSASKPISIKELSYTGEKLHSYNLNDSQQVVNIVKKDDTTYVLTLSGIHLLRNGRDTFKALYFSEPADMTIYKNKVIVLANDGLWQIADDGSFQLLYKFTAYGYGLTSSLSLDPLNNQLIFGTRPKNNQKDNSATFVTSL